MPVVFTSVMSQNVITSHLQWYILAYISQCNDFCFHARLILLTHIPFVIKHAAIFLRTAVWLLPLLILCISLFLPRCSTSHFSLMGCLYFSHWFLLWWFSICILPFHRQLRDPLQLMAEWFLIILCNVLSKILLEVLTSAKHEVESYTIPYTKSFHFDSESWITKPAAFSQHDVRSHVKCQANHASLTYIWKCHVKQRQNLGVRVYGFNCFFPCPKACYLVIERILFCFIQFYLD